MIMKISGYDVYSLIIVLIAANGREIKLTIP